MWRQFSRQLDPENNRSEQEPLLANNKKTVSYSTITPTSKVTSVASQPKKAYRSSKQNDPLQYGFFPYRDSLWSYAGFKPNLPKVFFPDKHESDQVRKFKR